jgi:hypothetical protein
MIRSYKDDELLNQLAGMQHETFFTIDQTRFTNIKEEVFKMTTTKVIKTVPEGKHTGTIIKVSERNEPFEYADFVVHLDDANLDIKYGLPNNISIDEKSKPSTKLAKLCVLFGAALSDGKDVNLQDLFLNKKITCMTQNESGEKGTFARVVDGSLKPLEE